MENNNNDTQDAYNGEDYEIIEELERQKKEVQNILALHGCNIPMDTQVFNVLFDMALKGQMVRIADSEEEFYYEWSPIAIALIRPFMKIDGSD